MEMNLDDSTSYLKNPLSLMSTAFRSAIHVKFALPPQLHKLLYPTDVL